MTTSVVKAVALHGVHFLHEGKQVAKSPADAPFDISRDAFEELESMNAVRKATKDDAGGHDDDLVVPPEDPGLDLQTREYSVEETAAFVAHHRGGGKYDVRLGDLVVSNGDDDKGFDKAGAEAWLKEARTKAGVTDDLLS